MVIPNFAHAGAWQIFRDNCLFPIESGELVQLTDMTPSASFKNDGDTYSKYNFDNGAYILSISDSGQWCYLVVTNEKTEASADIANEFLAWSSQLEVIDRYQEIEGEQDALMLVSAFWRTPKMSVTLRFLKTGILLRAAEEVDLDL
ncbi:hypothetical protein [Parasulfitobacter algicola]|uniref:Uncharacterized protein n=1 Tax=Parasulfitobacter algicola TaxID=2614809 RepID=A0ABX2IQ15_9RHOB|nr:hypothetical protein [Sulfitobacter algicola]NSX54976.1 hypothetical protein [Sulfitobacter algicola]